MRLVLECYISAVWLVGSLVTFWYFATWKFTSDLIAAPTSVSLLLWNLFPLFPYLFVFTTAPTPNYAVMTGQ